MEVGLYVWNVIDLEYDVVVVMPLDTVLPMSDFVTPFSFPLRCLNAVHVVVDGMPSLFSNVNVVCCDFCGQWVNALTQPRAVRRQQRRATVPHAARVWIHAVVLPLLVIRGVGLP